MTMDSAATKAAQQHDNAWPRYMRAWARVRASGGGRGSFAAQEAFLRASEAVGKAQDRMAAVDADARAKWIKTATAGMGWREAQAWVKENLDG